MYEEPPGGGDYVAIDPQKVGDVIKSINSHAGGNGSAQPVVTGWMSQASRCGLDTSRLSTINKHLTWAGDQLPMLRRRQSLALDMQKQNTELGYNSAMVSAGAGPLGTYKTQAAAQKAGQKDAQAFKNGDLSLQDYMKKLAANESDPDYCKAAMQELGDARLKELAQDSGGYDPSNPEAGMYVLSTAAATAMRNGVTFKDDKGNEDLNLLAPMTKYATFPNDVLANLGKQCLNVNAGNYDDAKDVFNALAADPQAASEFLIEENKEHPGAIPEMLSRDTGHGGFDGQLSDEFYNVIKAGTLDDKSINPDLAAKATQSLVKSYAASPDAHAHDTKFDALYSQVIKAYWPDLVYSLTSPNPGANGTDPKTGRGYSPDGMALTPKEWAAFTDEAMLDPGGKKGDHGAPLILALAHKQRDLFEHEAANQKPKSDSNSGDTYSRSAGLVSGFFDYQAKNTYNILKSEHKDADGWKSQVADGIGMALDIGVDVVADPGAAAKTITVGAVKDVLGVTKDQIKDEINKDALTTDGSLPPPQYDTWQDTYSRNTLDELNSGKIPASTLAKYDNGSFLTGKDGNKTVKSNLTPKEMAAYNAWLQDPQVSEIYEDAGEGTVERHYYGEWTGGQEGMQE